MAEPGFVCAAPGCRFSFTVMVVGPDGRPSRDAEELAVALVGAEHEAWHAALAQLN